MSFFDANGGPDARQECPCSNDPSGYDDECDIHGEAYRAFWAQEFLQWR